jgi:DNA gyrase subunit B
LSKDTYVGVPPLYKVERGRKAHYCFDDAFTIVGKQPWILTTRKLKQLTVEDVVEENMVFSLLMGNWVEPQRNSLKILHLKSTLRSLIFNCNFKSGFFFIP